MNFEKAEQPGHRRGADLLDMILKALPLAMGIAVTVLSALGELDARSGISLLGIGLACVGIRQMRAL